MWGTKRHWDRFLFEYFGVSPVSIIPPVPHTNSFICHRRYTNLATDRVLLSKSFYCCVSRIAVYRTDVGIHEHCLVPEAPVLHTASLLTAKTLLSVGNPAVALFGKTRAAAVLSVVVSCKSPRPWDIMPYISKRKLTIRRNLLPPSSR